MTGIFIDRRVNGTGRSSENRQKFLDRIRGQVRDAVKNAASKGNIKDLIDGNGQTITVPGKGLKKPEFRHGSGGILDRVLPGNKKFTPGDRVDRPDGGNGQGAGSGSSADGEGEDEFSFVLTKEEFLNIFFEGLELPDLLKKELAKTPEWKIKRAGYSTEGNPSQLSVIKTLSASKTRRLALKNENTEKAKELKQQIREIIQQIGVRVDMNESYQDLEEQKLELENELKEIKKLTKHVPFIDDMDLRYNRWQKEPIPTTRAVFFCLMDVSGSMGQTEKNISKRFFMLLYLFLTKAYDSVDIVFIRYHTTASEVDEHTFFYDQSTGGTNASTAVALMDQIMKERYSSSQWNVYGAICSDGDDWMDDIQKLKSHLHKIIPKCQYFPYIEIDKSKHKRSDLWATMEEFANQYPQFVAEKVHDDDGVYPIFRKLFAKK